MTPEEIAGLKQTLESLEKGQQDLITLNLYINHKTDGTKVPVWLYKQYREVMRRRNGNG